ncbi:uncharacterized protein LAESUDRAFT_809721 [Laetiporus sulphureus 93-53]|uniref:NadR/Ttd14 AAA domain-containing protein n=1 Tax=Laetiporus sulphureus 93-53 TaxID=1314785 RepID=A0A165GUF5_9APHY|nr:uncharacterized protein LAESUDRAFT_809721 [Laetiporus sulphureus 93-53]KZT10827.1 hypothetical protein LAESUDRAFT_809721 [Laetiporus sulphureus 93-53]
MAESHDVEVPIAAPADRSRGADLGCSKSGITGGSYEAIFVLGPSSSGKTTLCEALAKDLEIDPSCYIKEVARTVMRAQGFTRADTDTYEMQYAIMSAQLRTEEEVIGRMGGSNAVRLLSDRSAIDPIVYASTSTVSGALERRQRLLADSSLHAILPFYRDSLFVVLQPVREWMIDDGVRSLEDPWIYLQTLHATLDELKIPYIVIGEDTRDINHRVGLVRHYLKNSHSTPAQ